MVLCIAIIPLAGNPHQREVIYIQQDTPIRPYEDLWLAVCKVESNFNPYAIGDLDLKEKSYGIAQIRRVRLDDYNDRTGNRLKLTEMYDPKISKEIFMFYATKFHHTDYEHIARRWNGSGYKTLIYWGKVKKHLATI